jgi:hypothetical protein
MISKTGIRFFSFLICFAVNAHASNNPLVEIRTDCGRGAIIECEGSYSNGWTKSIKCKNIPIVGSKIIDNTNNPKDFVTHWATDIKFQLHNNLFTIVDKNKTSYKFSIDATKNCALMGESIVDTLYMKNQVIYRYEEQCKDIK